MMHDRKKLGTADRIIELFESGKEFTEDLLKENERLRTLVGELRQENRDLREQFESTEEENREFADRYVQIERQNTALVNLYVASYRLHSTLSQTQVIDIIKEIVINMVGSEAFAIYAVDPREGMLHAIAQEGLEGRLQRTVSLREGTIGQTAHSGEVYVASEAEMAARRSNDTEDSEPLACIPLCMDDRVLGIIVIYDLLYQKNSFQQLDFELFELLGGHAATAMYVTQLYQASERKRATLEGLVDLLRRDFSSCPSPNVA